MDVLETHYFRQSPSIMWSLTLLHLFLRICDVLVNLLVLDLRRLDGIKRTKTSLLDKESAMNVSRYEHFLKESVKLQLSHVYWQIYPGFKMVWSDWPRKMKTNFSSIPHATLVQKLWKNFLNIYETLCLKSKTKSKNFKQLFEIG